MTSNQPYLLRAFYEWLVDNNLTPYIVVDATVDGVVVPQEHIKDGQIVLNISPGACGKLQMGNVDVTFEARFGGVARSLAVPCQAVLAIYARENGAGTVFTLEEHTQDELSQAPSQTPIQAAPEQAPKETETDVDTSVVPKKGRPNLTIVK